MTYQQLANIISLMTKEEKSKPALVRSNNLNSDEEILLISKEYSQTGLDSVILVTEKQATGNDPYRPF